ncbi:MAG: hypothetical protein KW788_02600 [Candidatus Doudnabacteria bacterium]|nr:hypothetical protein [Candidatus Doudnabacteria bacterium]
MALSNKIFAITFAIFLLAPLSAKAGSSAYLNVGIEIKNGKINYINGVVRRIRPDFEWQMNGAYTITLFDGDKTIAENHFDIPQSFDIESHNLDGTYSMVQSSTGIVNVDFKSPDNFVIKNDLTQKITVKITMGSEKIYEESVKPIDWDYAQSNPAQPLCGNCSPAAPLNPFRILMVVSLLGLLLTILTLPFYVYIHIKNNRHENANRKLEFGLLYISLTLAVITAGSLLGLFLN